ncbi:uncharacterized protein LOC129731739 isoform X2 [Wyeomyia smithii]|uniref:uncharacterized protein LOC129731739 isoform X2 n=1 Tax=Wyeomyia smithii TaxID=174621 RepID=UPI002467B412|nr:uncharacterized protein LOC129731739 isoform X2 [Wyeomyia smithii]
MQSQPRLSCLVHAAECSSAPMSQHCSTETTVIRMRPPDPLRAGCRLPSSGLYLLINSSRPPDRGGSKLKIFGHPHIRQVVSIILTLRIAAVVDWQTNCIGQLPEAFEAVNIINKTTSPEGTTMKKDEKHVKDRPDRKIIRHPTAPFSTKAIIINLIIAFFLYLLRRVIAGGKSAITKYSRFIK